MCQIGGLACVAIRFPSDAVSRSLRIQIWILTAVGDSVTDLPPFSRVTSGWLTSGYSRFASARTHPPHCRQEAAVPPRAVRGCPPRLPCRVVADKPCHSESTTAAKNDDSHAQTWPDCPSRCRLQTHRKDSDDTALTTLRCLRKITPHPLVV